MNTILNNDHRWSALERIGFRFLFAFIVLFIFIDNNGAFPFFEIILEYPTEGLHLLIPWIGEHILHLPEPITYFTAGSGDTTYDYVILLFCLVLAIVTCVIWTLLDRKHVAYPKLYYWLTVIVRFYVGLMLINYGLVKIFKLQFPYPQLYRLTQPYGDSSPMGLAWTFLGFSYGYNIFMGIAEVSAVLLLFRRTATFGAILTMFTAANVMAINYFYDVPVKILSSALFLLSIFILSRDIKRLFIFFFTGRAVELPVLASPVDGKRRMRIASIVVKTLLILYLFGYGSYQSYQGMKMYGDLAPKSPWWGLYEVNTFVINRDTLPPLTTDRVRWNKLAITGQNAARISFMRDSMSWCGLTMDTVAQTLIIKPYSDTTKKYSFAYEKLENDVYTFRGTMASDSLFMRLRKTKSKPEDFRLTGRGFHWVNEFPFNR